MYVKIWINISLTIPKIIFMKKGIGGNGFRDTDDKGRKHTMGCFESDGILWGGIPTAVRLSEEETFTDTWPKK